MRWVAAVVGLAFAAGCGKPPSAEEFMAMAAKGATRQVRAAVEAGAKLDFLDKAGYSPLATAAFNGHLDTVRTLLEAGANPDIGKGIFRPLTVAVSANHREIVELLLAQKVEVRYGTNEDQPIGQASDPKIIEMLVEAGANVNQPSGAGLETCLHRAAALGNVEAVQKLLELGASVHVKNVNEWTPLHYAVRMPRAELRPDAASRTRAVIKLLVAAGADVNAPDRNRNTPLHIAARNRRMSLEDLQFLIAKGGRLDAMNLANRTPRQVAEVSGLQNDRARLALLSARSE